MPRLITTTITITRADLKALVNAQHGTELPNLDGLINRAMRALDQAASDRKALNATSRRLKKTVGAKS